MARQYAKRSGLTATVALLAVLVAAPAARADDKASARQHQARADALKQQGKLAEACTELAEVLRFEPKLATLLELAECYESSGQLIEAQTEWALARDRAKHDEKPQSRARAETRLAAVQKQIPHLTLQLANGTATGAQVLCDDVALEPALLSSALPLNPGDHVVVVKLSGHDDAKYPVKLAEGDNQTLPIAVGPATATATAIGAQGGPAAAPPAALPSTPLPAPPAAAPPSEPPPVTGWWSMPHKAGVIVGSVGLLAVGGGSALCLLANDPGGHVDQRVSWGGISIVTGGVLLVSGLVLLASAPRDDATQHARVLVTPTFLAARDAALLGAAGQF